MLHLGSLRNLKRLLCRTSWLSTRSHSRFSQWLIAASRCFARFRGCCRWLLFGCHSHGQGGFHSGSIVRWQSGNVVTTGCSIGDYPTKAAFDLWGHVRCCWCFTPPKKERTVLNIALPWIQTKGLKYIWHLLGSSHAGRILGRTWIGSSNGSFLLLQRQRFWRSLEREEKGPCISNLNNRNVHRKNQLTFSNSYT